MFAAHLVACKINIFVIRGCSIGANMVPNAHAENGTTFNRKVSKMMSKCGPEGVPKTYKNQYQTVTSDFGRALVRVLSPPPWSWILTAAWGAGCRPKGVQTGWSIRLEWHTRVTCEALLAHRSASSTPETLQASFFGHCGIACDHPCALVSGVGPCLHLCAVCNMEHRIWYMEYGIWNTI